MYGLYTSIERCECHCEKCEIVPFDVESRYTEIGDGEVGWARPRAHFKSWWRFVVITYDMEVTETTGGRGTAEIGKKRCRYMKQ